MEAWIKENKAYLGTVGGIALGALLYYLIVLSPIQDGAADEAKKLEFAKRNYRTAAAGGVPEEPAVVQAEADVKAQSQKLDDMMKQLGLVLSERFTTKGKTTYVEQYNLVKLEVRDEWERRSQDQGISDFPAPEKLNFTSWTPDSETSARDALLRLGIADTAMRVIIESMEQNEKIEGIDVLFNMAQDEPDDLFLRRLPIQVKVIAKSKSIFRMIHALQGRLAYVCPDHPESAGAAPGKCGSCPKERIPKSYLVVDRVTIARTATTAQDSFEAELTVTGLRVDAAKPIEPVKAEY